MSSAIDVSNFRRRRKENLIRVCGNQCNICGYCKTKSALEFHHIKPEEKSYSIAAKGTCHDLEADLAEIKKCILVCANCHREIHDNLFSVEDLMQYKVFKDEIAEELRQNKGQKQFVNENGEICYSQKKQDVFCKECGIKISQRTVTGLCEQCINIARRTVQRPNREELKELIRTTPFTQIGKMYNVSDNSIRKWCKAENLPTKVTEIKQYTDEEWALV